MKLVKFSQSKSIRNVLMDEVDSRNNSPDSKQARTLSIGTTPGQSDSPVAIYSGSFHNSEFDPINSKSGRGVLTRQEVEKAFKRSMRKRRTYKFSGNSEKQKEKTHFSLINPKKLFIVLWNFFLFYFFVAFLFVDMFHFTFSQEIPIRLKVTKLVISCLFGCDMILRAFFVVSPRLALRRNGAQNVKLLENFKEYMKVSLLLDLIPFLGLISLLSFQKNNVFVLFDIFRVKYIVVYLHAQKQAISWCVRKTVRNPGIMMRIITVFSTLSQFFIAYLLLTMILAFWWVWIGPHQANCLDFHCQLDNFISSFYFIVSSCTETGNLAYHLVELSQYLTILLLLPFFIVLSGYLLTIIRTLFLDNQKEEENVRNPLCFSVSLNEFPVFKRAEHGKGVSNDCLGQSSPDRFEFVFEYREADFHEKHWEDFKHQEVLLLHQIPAHQHPNGNLQNHFPHIRKEVLLFFQRT